MSELEEYENGGSDEVTINIKCTMSRRWVPHFTSMLRHMQRLGSMGSSRVVSLMSDGDGDFRPTFEFDSTIPEAPPVKEGDGDHHYDAG